MGWLCESSAATLAQPLGCACCGRDLTNLQTGARFCPDCGSKIPVLRHRHFSMIRRVLPLIHLGRGDVPDTGAGPGRTAILIGYANAMYHLGWRYERGNGTPKNLPEAKRCYKKSARLGNLDAIVRLAPSESETPVPVVPITQ